MIGESRETLDIKAIAIFFLVTLVIYYRSLFGNFIFDDVIVVLREPLLKKRSFFDFLRELPFKERPVRLFTFYIDRLIWGLNPFGYRFTNLIIHILNGFLVYYLLLCLKLKREVILLTTSLFLWHFSAPATVCYVTGRKDLLGFFFSNLAFLSLIRFNDRTKKVLFFLLFFLLAFFTKEMFITVPVIVYLYNYFVLKKSLPVKYIVLTLLGILGLTFFVILFRDVNLGSLYKRLSIPEYFISYIRLFFDPFFPKVDYVGYFQEPYRFSDINWRTFLLTATLTLSYFLVALKLKKKDTFLAFLLFAFFISLLPVLQIIQHSESFAEHYFYFPLFFASLFFSELLFKTLSKRGFVVVSCLVLIIFAYFCYQRTKVFMSEENFWNEAYRKNPKSFRAMQYYGQKLLYENKIDEAYRIFQQGLKETTRLYNYSELAYTYYYDFLNNLALCYIAKNELDKAEQCYLEGLRTIPESDKKQLFLFNLSIVYLRQDKEKGKKFMRNLFFQNQRYVEIGYLLYDVYWMDGKMNDLEVFIDDLLRKNPSSYFALAKKILLLLKRGEKELALQLYSNLKRLSPSNYYELNDGAEIEIALGNYNRAKEYLLMALEEKSEYGRTKKNLQRLELIEKQKAN